MRGVGGLGSVEGAVPDCEIKVFMSSFLLWGNACRRCRCFFLRGGRTEEVSFKHGNRRKTMRLYEALSARILKSERELAEENEGKERKKKRSDKEDEEAPVPPVSETEGDAVSIKVPEDEVIMRIN